MTPFKTAIPVPVLASHSRAVLSSDAVATRRPSGLNAALHTEPSWPIKTAISVPVSASHSRAVLSKDAVATRWASRLNAALRHADPGARDPVHDVRRSFRASLRPAAGRTRRQRGVVFPDHMTREEVDAAVAPLVIGAQLDLKGYWRPFEDKHGTSFAFIAQFVAQRQPRIERDRRAGRQSVVGDIAAFD